MFLAQPCTFIGFCDRHRKIPRIAALHFSSYNSKKTLEKSSGMTIIVPNVAYKILRLKGNSSSRSKYAFEVEFFHYGGKLL